MTLLPSSRNRTYNTSDPIVPGDINDLQDCVAGAKLPSMPVVGYPVPLSLASMAWTVPGGTNAPYFLSSGGATSYFRIPDVYTGDRITGFAIAAFGDGVVDVSHIVKIVSSAMGMSDFCNSSDNNRAAAWGDYAPTLAGGPHVMLAGESLLYIVAPNAANARIGRFILTKDRL